MPQSRFSSPVVGEVCESAVVAKHEEALIFGFALETEPRRHFILFMKALQCALISRAGKHGLNAVRDGQVCFFMGNLARG